MSEIIHELIENSLEYYFSKKLRYQKIFEVIETTNKIENKNKFSEYIKMNDVTRQSDELKIKFIKLNEEYDTEILGLFSNKSKVFSWGWVLPSYRYGKTYLVKKLFDYAYSKDINDKFLNQSELNFFLKVLFSNSRTKVENEEQIELILAISQYLLKETDNLKLIIPLKYYLSEDKDDFIIMFYLLKEI